MKIVEQFPLADILYYKIGGVARYLLIVQSKEDVLQALDFVKKNNIIKVLPIGLGSNLLLNDALFDGAVLLFKKPETPLLTTSDSIVESFAAQTLDDVIQFAFANSFIGIEWAGGLPTTVGGAVRGNVGAFGSEIKKSVSKVFAIDIQTLEQKEFTNEQCKFNYRDSIFKQNKNLLITSVEFLLQKADTPQLEEAKKTYQKNIEYRKTNHPVEYPSCGSVFKNITQKEEVEKILSQWPDIKEVSENKWHNKIAMGYIINRLGFTGKISGGAQVSDKHSNYIINKNNATFKDVVTLIDEIKKKFFDTFGFYPEPEVQIVY
jgi:UDP-N-acetylmuramate dehydrogenase